MILSNEQVSELILNPKNKEIIEFQVKQKKTADLHICGLGLHDFLEKLDGVENENYIHVKQKLSNTITQKCFEKALRPKDKITSARGGLKVYEFSTKNENNEKALMKVLSEIDNGNSLEDFIKTIWLDYGIWVDAHGITFVENKIKDGIITDEIQIKYVPTFERINKHEIFVNFHDYEYTRFNKFEYIILNIGKDENGDKLYRVYDDKYITDFVLKIQSKTISEIPNSRYVHGFYKVPAVFNSNKVDKKGIDKWFTTYANDAFIVAKDYLNDYTDYRIYKKKLGIPTMWRLKMKCPICQGEGKISELNHESNTYQLITCPSCNGDGASKERTLTDIIELDLLDKELQSNIPPAGSVTLPIEIQDQMRKELDEMEFDISETIWGQGTSVEKSKQKETTAFEISVRNESKIDKLKIIDENRCLFEKSIVDLVGYRMFGEKFSGAIISPNTQFFLLTPTESRQVYLQSKEAKSPSYQLDKLYIDYLRAEYYHDPISFERQVKIMLLTPMPHADIMDVKDILTEEELTIKKNIEKYIYRYEKEDNGNIITDTITDIYNKFKDYAKQEDKNSDFGIRPDEELGSYI